MNTLTRKQRELANRHALFLEIAKRLIHEHGFHQLSMDRIAELAEYSKGTVYQHFPCKEQILVELCNNNLRQLASLVEKAAVVDGNQRERMFAFFMAHEYWERNFPQDVIMMQNMHHDGVLAKAEPESQQEHGQLQTRIISTAVGIIDSALKENVLPAGPLNSAEIVYALWSTCHGGQILRCCGIPLAEFGVSNPYRSIAYALQCTLNGFGWKPLMNEEDTRALEKRFTHELQLELRLAPDREPHA